MDHTVSYVLSLGLKDGSEQQKKCVPRYCQSVHQDISYLENMYSSIGTYIVLKSSKTANHAPPIFAHEWQSGLIASFMYTRESSWEGHSTHFGHWSISSDTTVLFWIYDIKDTHFYHMYMTPWVQISWELTKFLTISHFLESWYIIWTPLNNSLWCTLDVIGYKYSSISWVMEFL